MTRTNGLSHTTPDTSDPLRSTAFGRVVNTCIHAADIATLALVAIALRVALFGGFRIQLVGVLVTVHSSVRLIVIAAVLTAARHWLRPVPSIVERFTTATRDA